MIEEPTAVHAAGCAVWKSDDPCDCNAWRSLAACADLPPEESSRIFFPKAGDNMTAALAEAWSLCSTCPVRRDCASYADRVEKGSAGRRDHMTGIYGGETVMARLRRREGAA